MVWNERSSHNDIWKPYLFLLRSYGQGLSFLKEGQNLRSRSLGQIFGTCGKVLLQSIAYVFVHTDADNGGKTISLKTLLISVLCFSHEAKRNWVHAILNYLISYYKILKVTFIHYSQKTVQSHVHNPWVCDIFIEIVEEDFECHTVITYGASA